MQKRGVLIVSASTGTGHIRAGEALREAIEERDPDIPVTHVDLLAIAPSWVRSAYGGGYELMATRAPWLWRQVYQQTDGEGHDRARWSAIARGVLFREFRNLLLSSPWQLCLCTHFLPCQLAAGRAGLPPFALAVTDFTLHRYWVQTGVGQYFVATESLARELRPRVRRARVDVTGIPISPSFTTAPNCAEARAQLGIDPHRPMVLVMGGGLGIGVDRTVEAVLSGTPADAQLVAVCGRNSAAADRLASFGLPRGRLRILDFVTDIPPYIAAADVVVTKPGGLTASEALAMGKPLVLTRPIPGQETGNTRTLVDAGAALAALTDREIHAAMVRLFGERALLMQLATAARRLGRKDAAAAVASIVTSRRVARLPVAPPPDRDHAVGSPGRSPSAAAMARYATLSAPQGAHSSRAGELHP